MATAGWLSSPKVGLHSIGSGWRDSLGPTLPWRSDQMNIVRLAFVSFLAVPGLLYGGLGSSVSVVSSLTPAVLGSPVSLTAAVSPSAATGKVTFYEGVTV